MMLAFALGAVPALAFVQLNTRWLTARPQIHRATRRILPLVAAAFVVWRTLAAAPGAAPACHQTLDENRVPAAGDLAAR
jgi:sulfite exporter TauE/SafE